MRRSRILVLATTLAAVACSPSERKDAPAPNDPGVSTSIAEPSPAPAPAPEQVELTSAQLEGRTHVPKTLDDPARCQPCHPEPGQAELTISNIDALCNDCHAPDRHPNRSHPDKSHKSDIRLPVGMTTWLPLAEGERIGCHTCHDPHGTAQNLFRGDGEPASMCTSCHVGY